MSTTLTFAMPRDEVIAQIGNVFWPVPDGAPLLHVTNDEGITDGGVVIYPTPGQPGYLWWLVDGVIPPQAAGDVTAELAEQIPGSVLELPPPPDENPTPPN
ncbi:hypothetical protein [Streptomyces sp. NPDC048332]|uniref:hypothetical protein n=1 Tax=Streptomyces sp. NPDC048332 TaxID=3154619 RepID=UPI0034451D71